LQKSRQEESGEYKVVYPTVGSQRQVEAILETIHLRDYTALEHALRGFKKNPRPYGYLKLVPPTPILSSLAHYRFRVGDFRIFYDIRDDLRKVYIFAVRRRNERTY
jgi:mRNA-degrading endonuclease RelE of RelBE toxin-antitoxin system